MDKNTARKVVADSIAKLHRATAALARSNTGRANRKFTAAAKDVFAAAQAFQPSFPLVVQTPRRHVHTVVEQLHRTLDAITRQNEKCHPATVIKIAYEAIENLQLIILLAQDFLPHKQRPAK